MLDNILKTIDEKAKQEIDEIIKQKNEAIFVLESEHEKKLQDLLTKEKKEFSNKIKSEIEEFQQRKQLEADFKLQTKKNEIIEAVYNSAESRIADLSDADFSKIVKNLLIYISSGLEGVVLAGKRTANALHQLSFTKYKVQNDLKEEGLIFESKDMEIDLRISQILQQNREQTNPDVIKILFS